MKHLGGRTRRKLRGRKKIFGTAEKPRLSVYRSNLYTYAQIIDDAAGKTLVSSGKVKDVTKGKTKSDAAFETGKMLAAEATKAGIKEVIFDKNGYRYHGRVKQLAEGAREGGLKF